jgi:hypothetical protein
MYLDSGCSARVGSSNELLTGKAVQRDDESRLAATLRRTHGAADAATPTLRSERRVPAAPRRAEPSPEKPERKAAAAIVRAIEGRLPARIRELRVDVEGEQFILRGVSGSYYVKQVAGHLAMTTMDAHLLGRLSNEIEVRSVR